MSELRQRIQDQVKEAMKARDQKRLGVLRMVTAAFKQVEVDERRELDDAAVLAILDKLVKQRQDALTQYRDAGRDDLADQEQAELDILAEFLPEPLGDDEIDALIGEAITETGAESMKDMGRVMGILKPKMQGRADMGAVSARVKQRLGG